MRVTWAEVVAVDESSNSATIEPVPEKHASGKYDEVAFLGPMTIPRTATHWPPERMR